VSKLSDPAAVRKTVAGVCLIGFPFAGLASTLVGPPAPGNKAADVYATMAAHGGAVFAAGLIFMLSAILLVPATVGMVHLLRDRGVVLAHIGGALLLLGAFGHMGLAMIQMIASRVPHAGDRAALVATIGRFGPVFGAVLPLVFALAPGLILMAIALRRARLVPLWVMVGTIVTVLADVAGVSQSKPGQAAVWAGFCLTLGYVGLRVLALDRAAWEHPTEIALEPAAIGEPALAR
jgi:hypothetical protein